VRLILADDAAFFRDALAGALEGRGHRILAQLDDASSLVEQVIALQPDLAVIDIRMPPAEDAGLDAALRIRAADRRVGVLLLSHYVETTDVASLLGEDAAGVGYLLKDRVSDVAELDAAMQRIAAGGSVIDPAVVAAWLGRRRTGGPLDDLTPREREVLALMAEGRSNAAIATALGTGLKTIESHVAAIFSKLGLEPAETDNRRVLAVVTWLRSHE
jgi:DNA-binding NarL/FixJ family response regulator